MSRKEPLPERDWSPIDRYRDQLIEANGSPKTPSEKFALGEKLNLYAKKLYPDWPNEAERQADLENHARVSRLLRQAAAASGRE